MMYVMSGGLRLALAASLLFVGVVAQPNITAGPDDGGDPLIDDLPEDPFANISVGDDALYTLCDSEFQAFDACVAANGCEEACDMGDDDPAATMEPTSDDIFGPGVNVSALSGEEITASIQEAWSKECDVAKEEFCFAKTCCSACETEILAAQTCYTNTLLPEFQDQVNSFFEGVGNFLDQAASAVDAGLGFLNDVVSNVTGGQTIAPTSGGGSEAGSFVQNLFANISCDLTNIQCDADGTVMESDSTAAGGEPAGDGGEAPAPADAGGEPAAPDDGSAPAPAPGDAPATNGETAEAESGAARTAKNVYVTALVVLVGGMLL